MNWNRYLGELLGTFTLVFIGSMSILAANNMTAPILAVVPFGFGLALLAGIFAVGYRSGGHFNPAVSVAMFLDGRLGFTDMLMYWVFQILGALGASAAILAVTDQATVATTATTFTDSTVALVTEIALTTIFVLVIVAATRKAPAVAGFVIPLTLVAVHLAGIPFSGASVNPARSIGPAVVGNVYGGLWVYLVGPMVGGLLAWVLWRITREEADATS
ncbi:MAG TPA: aquaporin [Acidimicrobiia bacterium]|jgi:aquaporin Z